MHLQRLALCTRCSHQLPAMPWGPRLVCNAALLLMPPVVLGWHVPDDVVSRALDLVHTSTPIGALLGTQCLHKPPPPSLGVPCRRAHALRGGAHAEGGARTCFCTCCRRPRHCLWFVCVGRVSAPRQNLPSPWCVFIGTNACGLICSPHITAPSPLPRWQRFCLRPPAILICA